MPDEPIIVRNGAYQEPGQPEIMGVCIFLDDRNDDWDVAETANDTIVVTIKKGAKWRVEEYTDPATLGKMIQIYCEGGDLNSVVLKNFVNPDGDVYTPSSNPPDGETATAKLIYTYPDKR
ncbi:MAG: hypothetical protein ACKVX9_19210 [Blastocatellia bacterium]